MVTKNKKTTTKPRKQTEAVRVREARILNLQRAIRDLQYQKDVVADAESDVDSARNEVVIATENLRSRELELRDARVEFDKEFARVHEASKAMEAM